MNETSENGSGEGNPVANRDFWVGQILEIRAKDERTVYMWVPAACLSHSAERQQAHTLGLYGAGAVARDQLSENVLDSRSKFRSR